MFKNLEYGDVYYISVLKGYENDNDIWERDSEHHTPIRCLRRCAELVKSGIPEYHIRISSYDYDEEIEGGISFVASINYEEEQ